MQDRQECTSPPPAASPPFPPRARTPDEVLLRQTVLWRLGGGPYEAALEGVGDLLLELLNEGGYWGSSDEPTPISQLRAAGRDLESLAQFVQSVAAERFETALEPNIARLCERAESWAVKLSTLAHEVDATVPEVSS